jgi:hypothetical protein
MVLINLKDEDVVKNILAEQGLINPQELQLKIENIMFQRNKKTEGNGFVIRYTPDSEIRNRENLGLYMSNNYYRGGKFYVDCFPKISNDNIEKDLDKNFVLRFSKNGIILVEPRTGVSYYDADKVHSYGSYSTPNTIEEIVDYFGNGLKTEMYQVMDISRIPLLAKKSGRALSLRQITDLFKLRYMFENQTGYTLHETFYVLGKITPENVIRKDFLQMDEEKEDVLFQENFALIRKGWEILK